MNFKELVLKEFQPVTFKKTTLQMLTGAPKRKDILSKEESTLEMRCAIFQWIGRNSLQNLQENSAGFICIDSSLTTRFTQHPFQNTLRNGHKLLPLWLMIQNNLDP
jgi:hypothetical protein